MLPLHEDVSSRDLHRKDFFFFCLRDSFFFFFFCFFVFQFFLDMCFQDSGVEVLQAAFMHFSGILIRHTMKNHQ